MEVSIQVPSLPPEIWFTIAEYLTPHERIKLLQVCRRWRSLFFTLAYRHVWVDEDDLVLFVCAFQENPAIGSALRILTVDWWREGDFDKPSPKDHYDIPVLVHDVLERVCQTPEELDEWENSLMCGNLDAWLALLLTSLENLVSLQYPPSYDEPYVRQVILRAGSETKNPLHSLQKLESVTILEPRDGKMELFTYMYFHFFYLPSIRNIDLYSAMEAHLNPFYVGFVGEPPPPPPPAPGSSPIESLKVYGNGRIGMADFIRSCANLKHFDYQHRDLEIYGESYLKFAPKAFHKALSSQKHSLETLRLNEVSFDFDEERHAESLEDPCGWFGSLADFTKISYLGMRVANALDLVADGSRLKSSFAASLPRSLKSLRLVDCCEKHFSPLSAGLEEIASQRKERFRHLTTISIRLRSEPDTPTITVGPIFYEQLSPLKQTCRAAGIELTLLGPNGEVMRSSK